MAVLGEEAVQKPTSHDSSLTASCMAYVDLNPDGRNPEGSKYTSIPECNLGEFVGGSAVQSFEEHGGDAEAFRQRKIGVKPLLVFKTMGGNQGTDALSLTELNYLEPADQTGRVPREDK